MEEKKNYYDDILSASLPRLLGVGLAIALGFVVCMLLSGCRTQYVPVETVKVEHTHSTDTIRSSDTLRVEKETIIREANEGDSLLLARLGLKLSENERLLLVLQRELEQEKSKEVEHKTDTVVKVESVQVPYPVEKKLSRWEQIKMDFGALTMGISIVGIILFVMWLWKRRK